jgi:hypothetical protein
MPTGCEQRVSLKDRYSVTLREYIQAVDSLDRVPQGAEFERAYSSAGADTPELRRRAKGLSKASPGALRIIPPLRMPSR